MTSLFSIATCCALLFSCACIATEITAFSTVSTLPQHEVDTWVTWALQQQQSFQQNLPLTQQQLPSSHNSFNSFADGFFNSSFLAAGGQVLYNQKLSLAQQLELGVRRVTVEVHYVYGDLRVCRGGGEVAQVCAAGAAAVGMDVCKLALGIEDLGADTGCKASDPLLGQALDVIALFLSDPQHSQEFVVVTLKDRFGPLHVTDVETALTSAFGDMLFTPDDKVSATFPSVASLLEDGKRVVVFSDSNTASSTVYFSLTSGTIDTVQANNMHDTTSCTAATGGDDADAGVVVEESKVLINLCDLVSNHESATVRSYSPSVCGANFQSTFEVRGADTSGELDVTIVKDAIACQMTPSFDQVSGARLREVVWSWAEGTGLLSTDQGAVMVAASNGRWLQAYKHSMRPATCRAVDQSLTPSLRWKLTSDKVSFSGATAACISSFDGFVFAPPVSAYDNKLLLNQLRRSAVGSAWVAASTHPGQNGANHVVVSVLPMLLMCIVVVLNVL